MNTLLDRLESIVAMYPNHIAYEDENMKVTFAEVNRKAKQVGTLISRHSKSKQPIAVISQKSVWTPVLFLGVVYAGCFYVPIGTDQPLFRINVNS